MFLAMTPCNQKRSEYLQRFTKLNAFIEQLGFCMYMTQSIMTSGDNQITHQAPSETIWALICSAQAQAQTHSPVHSKQQQSLVQDMLSFMRWKSAAGRLSSLPCLLSELSAG